MLTTRAIGRADILQSGKPDIERQYAQDEANQRRIHADLVSLQRDYAAIEVESNSTETAVAVKETLYQVTVFDTNGLSNGAQPDHTEDHIRIVKEAVYEVEVSATINSVAGAASKMEMKVMKNNGASSIIPHMDMDLGGGGSESSPISLHGFAKLDKGDTVELWVENEDNTQNYVVEDISLTVKQIGV